ncbi:MAG: hypothetical protein LBK95_21155, partial [Bifidobacteriaceae bacterium]|nr:hypothetical protein [Bifidobacteriaceae bacterium]
YEGNAPSGSTTWTDRGARTTLGNGNYTFVLNSSADREYLVRVVQPTIALDGETGNRVNAVQTYANSGSFTYEGAANEVRALCAAGANNYQTLSTSGPCPGARADGIDPTSTANPLAASGGAAIVSRVVMRTDMAVPEVDFGVSAAASWGDSPVATHKVLNSEAGPYANPGYEGWTELRLGARSRLYADGAHNVFATEHLYDDGLEIAPYSGSGSMADLDWVPAQGRTMVAGQNYAFRAKAEGSEASAATTRIKAWITGVTGSTVSPTFNQNLLGSGTGGCSATPQGGYVYCPFQAVGSTTGEPLTLHARVRVADWDGVTADSRGPAAAEGATRRWVTRGEVEDYQLGVAKSVLRVEARTLGGVAAYVGLAYSNVLASGYSAATSQILTDSAGGYVSEGYDDDSFGDDGDHRHAVVSTTTPVVISTKGVGGANRNAMTVSMNGWQLSDGTTGSVADTRCFVTGTQTAVPATIDAAASVVTLAASSGSPLPADVTCRLTYAPVPDFMASRVKAEPSANQADPLVPGSETSKVTVDVQVPVEDADYKSQPTDPAGIAVALSLEPRTGTGATAAGAWFETAATDAGPWTSRGQGFTCHVDSTGGCPGAIRVAASQPGGYNLAAAIDGTYLRKQGSSTGGTDRDPAQIWYSFEDPDQVESSAAITTTAGQLANHDAPGSTAAAWGKQTVTVSLRAGGQPFKDGAGSLLAVTPVDGAASGVYYAAKDGQGRGVFACSVAVVGGQCPSGDYTLEVYASRAGTHQITVRYAPAQGAAWTVLEAGSGAATLGAVFTAPPVSAADSVIVFTGPGESDPANDWDSRDVVPDGVGVAHLTGHMYSLGIRVWDAGRNNPAGDESVRFRVEPDCPATFPGGVKTTDPITTSVIGKAATTLTSTVEASCAVYGELLVGGDWTKIPGSDGSPYTKVAVWEEDEVDQSRSGFEVSAGDVVADGVASGTVTVALVGRNGYP